MNGNRAIRVIKREQTQGLTPSPEPAVENSKEAVESARRVKTVLSAWSRESQQSSAQRHRRLNSVCQAS